MKDILVTVKENIEIAENIYMLTFTPDEKVGEICGGQFVNISTGDNTQLLRRPFGVAKTDGENISVCYQIKGVGTTALKSVKVGDKLKCMLPLGNGFNLNGYKKVAVIGGGVGVFPLVSTILQYANDIEFHTYIGFRNSSAVCFEDELKRSKTLKIVTDDGSYGEKGNAVSAYFNDSLSGVDAIISCGPPIMLKVLKAELEKIGNTIPCFVSLEERMGCGIGACLVCVCKDSTGQNKRVCKDGPVFDITKVEL